jgi:hypothetical protein
MTTDAKRRLTEATTPMREQRRAHVPLRLVLLIAAVFAMLAVLGGGAGLVLGKIASVGAAEHRYHQSTLYQEDWARSRSPRRRRPVVALIRSSRLPLALSWVRSCLRSSCGWPLCSSGISRMTAGPAPNRQ